MAIRVEQEDGVVLHALDEHAEALLTLTQSFLGLLAVRQVTGDFKESPNPAGHVPQGGDDHIRPEPGAVLTDPPALVLEAPLRTGDFQLVSGPAPVNGILRV